MADEHVPESGENLRSPIGDGTVRTPRWVKVSLIIAAIVALLLVILLLLGGGHGPGRHMALESGGLLAPALRVGLVSRA